MTHEIVTDCDSYIREIASTNIGPISEVDIFGPSSTLLNISNTTSPQIVDRFSLIHNYGYHALVVITFILFCYVIYNFRGGIILLFKMLFTGTSIDKRYQDQPLFFKQFLNICPILGFFVISGFIIKLTDITGVDDDYIKRIPNWMTAVVPIIVLVLACLISLYKDGAMWIIAKVTQTEQLFEEHKYMTQILLSICYTIITPLFLLFALNVGYATNILIYCSLFVYFTLFLVYMIKSYHLFMERNIFIVQWILYLCIVELFPLSLLLFLVLRNI